MATRPSWTGHLRFSLVTIPVQLFTASKSTRNIPLHQLHQPSMQRIQNQPVVEGIGPIDKKDIIKGYEYKKGNYVVLTADELDKIKLDTKKTINIVEFAEAAEIDPIYYDKPYYVIPDGDVAMEAYGLFYQALKKTGKVAIGEVVLTSKEHLISIKPYGKGLLMETLRYADEVRSANAYFSDLKLPAAPKEELDLAMSLIKKKSVPFDVTEFDDSYESALSDLIERKLKKKPLGDKENSGPTRVVNLMDALKKSLNEGKATSGKPAKAAKKSPAKKAVNKKTAAPKAAAKKKPAAIKKSA